jgi:hypothetical protein
LSGARTSSRPSVRPSTRTCSRPSSSSKASRESGRRRSARSRSKRREFAASRRSPLVHGSGSRSSRSRGWATSSSRSSTTCSIRSPCLRRVRFVSRSCSRRARRLRTPAHSASRSSRRCAFSPRTVHSCSSSTTSSGSTPRRRPSSPTSGGAFATTGWRSSARRSGHSDAVTTALDDVRRLELGGLSPGALHRLLRERLGTVLPRPVLRRVHDASGGNPFYALEIVRALAERVDRVSMSSPLPVPPSLQELLRERIAELPSETRRALVLAACLADPRLSVVSKALGADAERALRAAVEAEFVVLDDDVSASRIRFSPRRCTRRPR